MITFKRDIILQEKRWSGYSFYPSTFAPCMKCMHTPRVPMLLETHTSKATRALCVHRTVTASQWPAMGQWLMTLHWVHTVQCWGDRKRATEVERCPRYALKGKSKLQSQTSEKFIHLFIFYGRSRVERRNQTPTFIHFWVLRKKSRRTDP